MALVTDGISWIVRGPLSNDPFVGSGTHPRLRLRRDAHTALCVCLRITSYALDFCERLSKANPLLKVGPRLAFWPISTLDLQKCWGLESRDARATTKGGSFGRGI